MIPGRDLRDRGEWESVCGRWPISISLLWLRVWSIVSMLAQSLVSGCIMPCAAPTHGLRKGECKPGPPNECPILGSEADSGLYWCMAGLR